MTDPIAGARWRILQGDCAEVLPTIAPASIDAVITSPPYAMQRADSYGGVEEDVYPDWTVAWMSALRPALTPRASVLINIREHVKAGVMSDYVHRTRMALRADGWVECDELVWDKMGGMPCGDNLRPRRSWERILWFSQTNRPFCAPTAGVPSAKVRAMGGSQGGELAGSGWLARGALRDISPRRADVIYSAPGERGDRLNTHPAAFPLRLATELVHMFAPAGGLVCDPFTGSGTTGIAALRLGRRFVGCERAPEYVALATGELEQIGEHGEVVSEEQPSLFGGDA